MTPHGNDPSAAADPDNGILEGAPSVETSGIGLLGTQTAHVNIAPPSEEEDDDIVEGDIAFDGAAFAGGIVAIELPSGRAAEEEAAAGVAPDRGAGADVAPDQGEPTDPGPEPTGVEEIDAVNESQQAEEASSLEAADPVAAPVFDAATARRRAATAPVTPASSLESPRGSERRQAPAAARPASAGAGAGVDASGDIDTEPALPRLDEKEISMTDRSDRVAAPAEGRDLARTPPATSPASVPVSRRIGELSDVAERETSDLLTAERLLDPAHVARPEPEGGWQHLLYSITGGKVNMGDGKRARARKALDRRIAATLPGSGARFVAVVSRKGGVGKTTITTLLGQALADARDDRVIAVDANPDRGTLAERIARHSGRTVRDLVRERDNLRGYNDVSAIVARDQTRLDVLASDSDPRIAEAFSGDEYRAVADVAAHYYSVVLTDTGTGIVHSVMGATLERADRLVVVAGRSIDEARLASETLTWLEANGYEDQVRSAIVVLNMSSPGAPVVRLEEVEAHFRTRVRDVMRIPYDPQLATGGAIVFRDLQPATRAAARELAARVVEGLRSVSSAA